MDYVIYEDQTTEKKNILNWIWKHRGTICFGAGTVIAAYVVHKNMKIKYDTLKNAYDNVKVGLSDADAYAQSVAKEMATNILDCAYSTVFEEDLSPEGVASHAVVNAVEEWADKAFVDYKAVQNEASRLLKLAIKNLTDDGEIGKTAALIGDVDIFNIEEDEFGHNCIINGLHINEVGKLGEAIKNSIPEATNNTEISLMAEVLDKMDSIPEGIYDGVEVKHF